jgi:hypothetical protein
MVMGIVGAVGIAGAIGVGWLWFTPAGVPDRLEYLPAGVVTPAVQLAQAQPARGSQLLNFARDVHTDLSRHPHIRLDNLR